VGKEGQVFTCKDINKAQKKKKKKKNKNKKFKKAN